MARMAGGTKYSPLYGNGSTEEALRYERIAQVERSASQAVLSPHNSRQQERPLRWLCLPCRPL